jgi:hypothetical protein
LTTEKFRENTGGTMRVQQVSIFLENSAGRLAEVTKILKDAQIKSARHNDC